jgi:hypothetical protein
MSIEGLLAIMGSIVTGGFTALMTYLAMRHRHKREEKEDEHKYGGTVIDQYKEIADRLEKQNDKWEKDSERKQKLIDELVERETQCQISLTRYWAWMQAAQTRMAWLTKIALQDGHQLQEDLLPLPEPPKVDNNLRFNARTSAQDTASLKASQSKIIQPPPSNP